MADITRRSLLKVAAFGAVSLTVPNIGFGSSDNAQHQTRQRDWRAVVLDRDRWLHVYRPQSKETAKVCYYRKGKGWQKQGYEALCHMLRDVEYKTTQRVSPKLLDLLYITQALLRAKKLPYVIHINSGYRTPEHNGRLSGAADASLHMKGMAADISVPGLPVARLSKLVQAIGVGGVGVYPHKNFVHVDVGRVRKWVGSLHPANDLFELDDPGELFAGELLAFEQAA
jgi:uncharacterized protein YcbK (DUF882 family)